MKCKRNSIGKITYFPSGRSIKYSASSCIEDLCKGWGLERKSSRSKKRSKTFNSLLKDFVLFSLLVQLKTLFLYPLNWTRQDFDTTSQDEGWRWSSMYGSHFHVTKIKTFRKAGKMFEARKCC